MSERNRDFEEEEEDEALSTNVLPFKKRRKLDDADLTSVSHHVAFAASDSSNPSFAALASDECSVTSTTGDENYQSSCISSSESKEIATNSSEFICTTSNFRKEANRVSEDVGETTTEMERKDNRRKPPKVSKTPTAAEIEDFFRELENEEDNQKQFIEKYNFDIVNDEPLEGRYKWDRLKP